MGNQRGYYLPVSSKDTSSWIFRFLRLNKVMNRIYGIECRRLHIDLLDSFSIDCSPNLESLPRKLLATGCHRWAHALEFLPRSDDKRVFSRHAFHRSWRLMTNSRLESYNSIFDRSPEQYIRECHRTFEWRPVYSSSSLQNQNRQVSSGHRALGEHFPVSSPDGSRQMNTFRSWSLDKHTISCECR